MDQKAKYEFANLFEAVVAVTAEAEFRRLTDGLTSVQKTQSVQRAAMSVNRVQQLAMPRYEEELVALFYAGRFQLSHVNLAYSLISRMVASRDPNSFRLLETGRLQVVDFGCGTLAMRFGVILAAADALERGQNIESIHIDSIDPNTAMVNMGIKVWDGFLELARKKREVNSGLRWINAALDRLTNLVPSVQKITLNQVEPHADADVWLSAIHIVYGGNDGNENEVREDLARLTANVSPSVGIITCHGRNIEIARRISPFSNGYVGRTERPRFEFSNQILTPLITRRCIDWGFFPPNWRVFWQWDKNPENTTCLIYHKATP